MPGKIKPSAIRMASAIHRYGLLGRALPGGKINELDEYSKDIQRWTTVGKE